MTQHTKNALLYAGCWRADSARSVRLWHVAGAIGLDTGQRPGNRKEKRNGPVIARRGRGA
jgi:hypothetical protein